MEPSGTSSQILSTESSSTRRNHKSFTNLYHRLIGESLNVDRLIYQAKKLMMDSALSSEVNVLSHMLDEISSTNRRARDFTRKALRDAIRETIACFPVYRTYVDERGHISARDREYIAQAVASAKRINSAMAPQVFDFLHDILLLREDNGGNADLRLPQSALLRAQVSATHRPGDGQGIGRHRLLRLQPLYFGE